MLESEAEKTVFSIFFEIILTKSGTERLNPCCNPGPVAPRSCYKTSFPASSRHSLTAHLAFFTSICCPFAGVSSSIFSLQSSPVGGDGWFCWFITWSSDEDIREALMTTTQAEGVKTRSSSSSVCHSRPSCSATRNPTACSSIQASPVHSARFVLSW